MAANWTEYDITKQYNRAVINGWRAFFAEAADRHSFDTELLMAIASRETNMQSICGDYRDGVYHGFGIMQVDAGTDAEFCANWSPEQVEGSIQRGAAILAEKRQQLAAKGITELNAIAAAYNTGASNVIRSLEAGKAADATTTGHDYGSDVMARRAEFVKLSSGSDV